MKESSFDKQRSISDGETMSKIGQELLPETREENHEGVLVPEMALKEEQGVFCKFEQTGGGKMKQVIASLMLISALVFDSGMSKAYAADVKQGTEFKQVEKKETREEIAMNLLETLSELPDNPKYSNNKTQQYSLKREVARAIIYFYALRRKLGFPEGQISGYVSPQDAKDALDELHGIFDLFLDKKYGNKDGKVDYNEVDGMRKIIEGNVGLSVFVHMVRQYSDMELIRYFSDLLKSQ